MNKKQSKWKKRLTNSIGALGYLTGFLGWLWALVIYSDQLLSKLSDLEPVATEVVEPVSSSIANTTPPNIWIGLIGVVVIMAAIALTIYMIFKIPATVTRISQNVTHKTAQAAAPLVIKAQHKPVTTRRVNRISHKLLWIIKLVFVVLPLVLAFVSRYVGQLAIEARVAMVVAICLAITSLVLFTLQYIVACWLKIDKKLVN